MFLQLFSIEWTRLTRRALLWVTLAASFLFIAFSQQNFYTKSRAELLTGETPMPGFSFDLANSLDQIMLIASPFLVILAAVMLGNDYDQRTNQHWLRRAARPTSLLAKFALLALVTFLIQWLALLAGGGIGWYFKTYAYAGFSGENLNWLAALAAPFYLTLVTLPYLALMLLITVATRSTFLGAALGLGYTQFIEILLGAIFYGAAWNQWMPRNLYLSATYQLNAIGGLPVAPPDYLLSPSAAFIVAAVYTLIWLAAAIWLYNRQDLGG